MCGCKKANVKVYVCVCGVSWKDALKRVVLEIISMS
jgi:hypothetical protein